MYSIIYVLGVMCFVSPHYLYYSVVVYLINTYTSTIGTKQLLLD